MVASRHPVRAALWLVLALTATAVCYLALGAAFAAAAQVVVYVGAIVVLVVFAIMLLRLKGDTLDRRGLPQVAVALAVAAGLVSALAPALKGAGGGPEPGPGFGSIRQAGELLLGPALLPFELISLLLLAAMVAAIVLGRKKEAE